MKAMLRMTQSWAALLTTQRPRVGIVSRCIRAMLLVPVFGVLLVLFRGRLLLGRPMVETGQSHFGQRYRCRPPDLIQMYILLFQRWEPDLTALIRERLRQGSFFIDVGANIGYFTLLASACVGEDGRVVAIDALPSNFSELKHNLALNSGTGNVRALNRAVSDAPGTLEVYAGPAHNVGLATTAPGQRHDLRREASIEAAPLSDLLFADEISRARVLKIDVEGAEAGVIAGMERFLAHCNPELEIFLELSPRWWSDEKLTPEDVIQPLRHAGFHTYCMDNNYWPWRYLWPNAIQRPKRVRRLPDKRVKRIDLVLSRIDAEYL
jgi:FkbM family methyltransferase